MTTAPWVIGDIRRLVRSGDVLGESPIWDPRTEVVVWIDAHESSALNTLDWRTGDHGRRPLPVRCTAIGLGAVPGEYVAALGDSVGMLDRSGAVLSKVAIRGEDAEPITNDGACDPAGNFWFGTTTGTRTPFAGSLWRFDGATIHKIAAGYTLSNGIAWFPDATSFFHVDSFEYIVRRNGWDPTTGRLDETPFVRFSADDGIPDGVALDTDGGLWIAFWGTGEVRRYAPDGELDVRLRFPVPNVTAVTFAGADRSTLVVTTARSTVDETPLHGSGDLYACDVGIAGAEPMFFGGKQGTPSCPTGG